MKKANNKTEDKRFRNKNKKEKKELNILLIDEKIRSNYEDDKKNIQTYKDRLSQIKKKLKDKSIDYSEIKKLNIEKAELEKKISMVENQENFINYILFSQRILKLYNEIINIPIKKTFMGKEKIDPDFEKAKKAVISDFINLAKEYIFISSQDMENMNEQHDEKCLCGSYEYEINEGTNMICKQCGLEYKLLQNDVYFGSIDRVNMNTKCKYGTKTHFKDTLNQFQGKQNKYIDKKIYEDLEKSFEIHGLVNPVPKEMLKELENIKAEKGDVIKYQTKIRYYKYSRIKRDHIKIFLSENKHNKYYEDIFLLHTYYTGIPSHDIQHLEEALLKDFDEIEKIYPQINENRVNFINNQYLLFQLLRKHKYKCKEEDFVILKTIDKQIEHDNIYEKLCNKLEWKFTPLF